MFFFLVLYLVTKIFQKILVSMDCLHLVKFLLFIVYQPILFSTRIFRFKMGSVWKRLQRVNKRAAKFQFTVSYNELVVETTTKWFVVIVWSSWILILIPNSYLCFTVGNQICSQWRGPVVTEDLLQNPENGIQQWKTPWRG